MYGKTKKFGHSAEPIFTESFFRIEKVDDDWTLRTDSNGRPGIEDSQCVVVVDGSSSSRRYKARCCLSKKKVSKENRQEDLMNRGLMMELKRSNCLRKTDNLKKETLTDESSGRSKTSKSKSERKSGQRKAPNTYLDPFEEQQHNLDRQWEMPSLV